MSNNFGIFLLFSMLVTGLVANSAFAEETNVDVTDTIDMAESSNSTSTETTATTESNSTSTEDETMVVEDEMTVSEDEMVETEVETMEDEMTPTVLSPLKQIKEGIVPENIVCKEGLGLVFKLNGQPACVKTTSIEKLIAWGWAR